MAHQPSKQLQSLISTSDWEAIKEMRGLSERSDASPIVRAEGLYVLGNFFWDHASTPFDCVRAVQCTREASLLHPLEGRPLKALGIRLIRLGCFDQGFHVLSTWLTQRHEWHIADLDIGKVHVFMGQAAQKKGDYSNAEMHYMAAANAFSSTDHTELLYQNACFLAEAKTQLGLIDEARWIVAHIPEGENCEGYRLRSLAEILYAENNNIGALQTGEEAASTFFDANAYYEASELFLFCASLYDLIGNQTESDKYLEVAEEVFLESIEHRLYEPARALLGFHT